MLDKEVLNVYNSMELLPTLNEIVDKFKPKNLFCKDYVKEMILPNPQAEITKENIKVVKNALIVGAYLAQIQKEQEQLLAGMFAQTGAQEQDDVDGDIEEDDEEENAAALEEAKSLFEMMSK